MEIFGLTVHLQSLKVSIALKAPTMVYTLLMVQIQQFQIQRLVRIVHMEFIFPVQILPFIMQRYPVTGRMVFMLLELPVLLYVNQK